MFLKFLKPLNAKVATRHRESYRAAGGGARFNTAEPGQCLQSRIAVSVCEDSISQWCFMDTIKHALSHAELLSHRILSHTSFQCSDRAFDEVLRVSGREDITRCRRERVRGSRDNALRHFPPCTLGLS